MLQEPNVSSLCRIQLSSCPPHLLSTLPAHTVTCTGENTRAVACTPLQTHAITCTPMQIRACICIFQHFSLCLFNHMHTCAITCNCMCTPVCTLSLSVPIRVSLCSQTLPKHTISPDSTLFALNGCCQHKSLAATVTEPDCSARIVISELLCVCNYGRKP